MGQFIKTQLKMRKNILKHVNFRLREQNFPLMCMTSKNRKRTMLRKNFLLDGKWFDFIKWLY